MQHRNTGRGGRIYPATVLFGMLAFFCFLSPLKASAQTQPASTKAPGPQILAYAQSHVGQGAEANTCEVFAEQALTGANDTIPKQVGASQAWDFFRSNWQQYGPCAPQPWDQSKVSGGDLVFWSASQPGSTCDKTYGHVAVYDGKGGVIENAGRGITDDNSVTYPCTSQPTGFVPMTSCNGPQNNNVAINNAQQNNAAMTGQSAPAAQPTSNPMSSMMSMMMPMMMMSMMMPMMSSMMSGMKGSMMSSSTPSSGTLGSASAGTGSTGTGSTGTGSSGSGSQSGSLLGSGSLGTASGSGSGSSSGTAASGSASSSSGTATAQLSQLMASLTSLLQGTPAPSSTASTNSSTAQPVNTVMEQLQQLEQQQAESGPASASASQPGGAATAQPAAYTDPSQDSHAGGGNGGHGDHRLSCGFTVGAGEALLGCGSAGAAAAAP